MAGLHFVLSFCFLALTLSSVKGLSDDEKGKIISVLLPHIAECSKDIAISNGAIDSVAATGLFSTLNPCFIACVFKKINVMDSKGLIDTDRILSFTKQYLSLENQAKIPKIIENCAWVNEKEVSDVATGCDRVKHMVDCFTPYRELFFPA